MNENRMLDAVEVLKRMAAEQPDLFARAEIVGQWIWISFESKPHAEIRDYLKAIGFHWNHKRSVWQHCGGVPSRHSHGDPRDGYGSVKASEILDRAA